VQFLKHKCAVTKLTKIALKQSSHLLVTLVDAPENSRGNRKEDKIGASEAPQKR
jgi:hypothetical protein